MFSQHFLPPEKQTRKQRIGRHTFVHGVVIRSFSIITAFCQEKFKVETWGMIVKQVSHGLSNSQHGSRSKLCTWDPSQTIKEYARMSSHMARFGVTMSGDHSKINIMNIYTCPPTWPGFSCWWRSYHTSNIWISFLKINSSTLMDQKNLHDTPPAPYNVMTISNSNVRDCIYCNQEN